jgi:putative endonuclease
VNANLRGAEAETLAERHLQAQGLKTVARNWRCSRGELDLVMRSRSTLVIVEVRRRSRSDYGDAFESVNPRKRGRVIHAARMFLAENPALAALPARFDVVAVDAQGGVEWLADAFQADE